jgi:hypothetical protein
MNVIEIVNFVNYGFTGLLVILLIIILLLLKKTREKYREANKFLDNITSNQTDTIRYSADYYKGYFT